MFYIYNNIDPKSGFEDMIMYFKLLVPFVAGVETCGDPNGLAHQDSLELRSVIAVLPLPEGSSYISSTRNHVVLRSVAD